MGKLILEIFNVFAKAASIREDEELKNRSVIFAATSIAYSLLMVGCGLGGAFLLTLSDMGILYIFILVIALTLLVSTVVMFIGALLRVIVQFTLNRKPMSWIALMVLIISVIATVILIFQFFS